MAIKIGHASSDERGKYSGGVAGDQTGKEVCIRTWYNRPWNKVVRFKDPQIAVKVAQTCIDACNNPNIGYDQNQRTTLYSKALAVNFDLTKISTPCECDCSSLVAVCVNAAGVPVSKDIYTGNMVKALEKTGVVELLTGSKYLSIDDNLRIGDILVYEGHHTAIALENGKNETASAQTKYTVGWNKDKNGWWYADTTTSYIKSDWAKINHHWYYFNADGYAVTGWQELDSKWYYFEPRAGHDYECAMYVSNANGVQDVGYFE